MTSVAQASIIDTHLCQEHDSMLYVISCTGGKHDCCRVEDKANTELTGYEWKVLLIAKRTHPAMSPYSSLLCWLTRHAEG